LTRLLQSRLFASGGVARPTLTLRYVQYSFAQCLPCALPAGKTRLFADGVFMRADPNRLMAVLFPACAAPSAGSRVKRSSRALCPIAYPFSSRNVGNQQGNRMNKRIVLKF